MDLTIQPNYNLNEQIYESSDKSIKIFKTRKRYTIQYIAVKMFNKKMHPDHYNYEYFILKNITHPNIVKCCGYSEDYNHFYMELEYCITGDLSKCLWQNKSSHYTEKIVKYLSTQILLALQTLHKNNILHCNLKPSNILIDEYGNIRLCDFKKALKVNTITQNEIRKNKSAMTPCYTAPELFSEEGSYNFKTDIWALGCIMFELAVGQVPFFDESVGKLMTKIINEEVNFNRKELQNFSDEFVDILRRLLDKDPLSRITWNELERHSFWELNLPPLESAKSTQMTTHDSDNNIINDNFSNRSNSAKSKNFSSSKLSNYNQNSNTNENTNRKKSVDILRLSKNALFNMMEDREDEYSREKQKEVDNADQEFKFEGQENQKNDEYDSSDRTDNITPTDNIIPNYEKFIKLKNPLEVSVLNVSHVIKRDKRKTNNYNEDVDRSIIKETDIPSIEVLMIHQSDKVIKPIIGNKIIEIIPQTTFNKSKLPFQPWKIDKIKEICRSNNIKMMENYLLVIYSLMDQYYNKGDDENLINILNFFETIIQDKEIANNIINTSFITIFITFLAKSKNDILKTRVCCIIAYLIRYSTVIENPLDELGLCKVLDTLVRDKNVELSKKAIATLGEYLFFVTTQAEGEDETSSYWKISEESLQTLLYAIDLSRDDVVKFYASKSIENITALTLIAKNYFASNDAFLNKFLDIYKNSKNQELRTSAIYTVSHIIRLEPKLFKYFNEKIQQNELQKFIHAESSKLQQALLNCILYGLFNNKQFKIFDEFLIFLIHSLEYSNSIIKMKIVLILDIMLENSYYISNFGEKVFHCLQKLRKENNNELHLSIKLFENSFVNKIKVLTKNFVIFIGKMFKTNNNHLINFTVNSNEEINQYLQTFLAIGSYTKIMSSMYSTEFLECLQKMIENREILDDNLLRKVYEILKKFSEHSQSVNENNEYVIKKMFIPILKSCFDLRLENKILPLNIAANMITLLLDDEKLYSSTILDEGKTKQINTLIIQILPLLKQMLKIEDLVFATLSFLSLIIERNSAFIKFYKNETIIENIFNLLTDQNFYSNLNLIKIFIKLIEYPETSFDDIINMKLIEKVNFLIANDNDDNNIYTEYVIELFYDLMFKINEQKKQIAVNMDKDEFKRFTSKIEPVAENFKMCIKLLGSENVNIQEKSCVSLIFLLQLFPDTYVESVGIHVKFTSPDILELLKGLEFNCIKIHKRMIRIFRWIIEFQNDAAAVLKPYISYITTYIENICNTSNDPEVVQLAKSSVYHLVNSLSN